jgi:hypothetical protein
VCFQVSGKWSWYATVSRNSGKYLPSSVKVGLEHHEQENGPDASLEIVSSTFMRLKFGFFGLMWLAAGYRTI